MDNCVNCKFSASEPFQIFLQKHVPGGAVLSSKWQRRPLIQGAFRSRSHPSPWERAVGTSGGEALSVCLGVVCWRMTCASNEPPRPPRDANYASNYPESPSSVLDTHGHATLPTWIIITWTRDDSFRAVDNWMVNCCMRSYIRFRALFRLPWAMSLLTFGWIACWWSISVASFGWHVNMLLECLD